jgi:hypothetical protein
MTFVRSRQLRIRRRDPPFMPVAVEGRRPGAGIWSGTAAP